MFPGESVSFSCHINISSGWEYLWLRGNAELGVSENIYSINSLVTDNSGSYTCKAKRGRNPFETDSSQAIQLEVQGKFMLTSPKMIYNMCFCSASLTSYVCNCLVRYFFFNSFCVVSLGEGPKALITQNPDVNEVYVGESVLFKCEVPVSSGWTYQWYKDDVSLSNKHDYQIRKASSSDNGTYKCVAKRDQSEYRADPNKRDLHILGENHTFY